MNEIAHPKEQGDREAEKSGTESLRSPTFIWHKARDAGKGYKKGMVREVKRHLGEGAVKTA